MVTVNVHEAKTHLSRLLQRAAEGEEVVIARAGVPVARLVRYTPPLEPRKPGAWKGRIWIADDFDDDLPDDLMRAWEGEDDFDPDAQA